MRIGFLNNQLDTRGTGDATFRYADYNEKLLENTSIIYTFRHGNHDSRAAEKFHRRFGEIRVLENGDFRDTDIDFLYHIKSGEFDGFKHNGVPYGVHAVFNGSFPHGDRYATISEWMGNKYKIPFVPHIVELNPTEYDYREQLGIPSDAIVFGRHGGSDTFDIPFVWDVINEIVHTRSDVWFLFLNTNKNLTHPKIMYFPLTLDEGAKKAFINTCDAMLHARGRGETFGLSVAEFAACGKPVLTYGDSGERAHIYEMRGSAITYRDEYELLNKLSKFKRPKKAHPFYTQYTPENVMQKFEEVFLS